MNDSTRFEISELAREILIACQDLVDDGEPELARAVEERAEEILELTE